MINDDEHTIPGRFETRQRAIKFSHPRGPNVFVPYGSHVLFSVKVHGEGTNTMILGEGILCLSSRLTVIPFDFWHLVLDDFVEWIEPEESQLIDLWRYPYGIPSQGKSRFGIVRASVFGNDGHGGYPVHSQIMPLVCEFLPKEAAMPRIVLGMSGGFLENQSRFFIEFEKRMARLRCRPH